MQPQDKSKNDKAHRYCCSNPNCKKVFSKPKIIKYYVCPTCQTIVDMNFENSQLIAREKPPTLRKPKEGNKSKKQEPEAITSQQAQELGAIMSQQTQELEAMGAIMSQRAQELDAITSQQATTDNEIMPMEKPEEKAVLETVEPAQMEEPNIVEVKVNKESTVTGDYDLPFTLGNSDEHKETVKEQKGQSSDFQCKYYFGYLSQRNKEEVIPETCFGCLKSIECMMSEYNKTKETIDEIKKWYSFKL